MLILVSAILLAVPLAAQESQDSAARPDLNRLGDKPVEGEVDLDLYVPAPDKPPSETAEQRAEREQRERQEAIARLTKAGEAAFEAGRIEQPPGQSAWHYYRSAHELDPANAAALAGLEAVQKSLIERAVGFAGDLDFETADRMLEEATLVRDDPALISQAQEDIRAFREEYAAELEVEAVRAMDDGNFAEAEKALIGLIALGGMDSTVTQLRRRMEEARIYGGLKPGQIIRDHFVNQGFWTPESVIVKAGSFIMGSSAFEEGRKDNEGPEHRVSFRRGFAIGRSEITVDQFRVFVSKTGYKTDAERQGYSTIYDHFSGRLTRRDGVDWEMDYEGKEAADDLPVVHVSWNDATAYTKWLSRGTGKPYRLPTESEFEYALRAGSKERYWWGDGSPKDVIENLTGERDVSRSRRQWESFFEGYRDRHWGPAPAASFKPNPFGLFDIGGNVGEWVMDCWHDSYIRAPTDGSAWINPGCNSRVIRGAFWASSPDQARSAYRLTAEPDSRDARIGFRIARDL
jgi:formylglycine-generating enzyme required for sulfatase activity